MQRLDGLREERQRWRALRRADGAHGVVPDDARDVRRREADERAERGLGEALRRGRLVRLCVARRGGQRALGQAREGLEAEVLRAAERIRRV